MTHQWTEAGLARLLNDVKKENGMEQIKDGGPAFPCHTNPRPGYLNEAPQGMTLRDYIAAKAMQGFCTQPPEHFESTQQVAEDAYRLADAMLAAMEGKS